ncbi:reverse transcriptase domain-containing protein, partial [Psittacicella hinzii]
MKQDSNVELRNFYVKLHKGHKPHIPKKSLLASIATVHNIMGAVEEVCANNGKPGVDGITCKDFKQIFHKNYSNCKLLRDYLFSSNYKHSAIRRVYIPKDNGDKRPLGIPTVKDRVMQQAVARVLSAHYDKTFSDGSCGYRPNRGCHDALRRAWKFLNQGYVYVIDMDLAKFFDTVNHRIIKQTLHELTGDMEVVKLVHRFLIAGILDNGKKTVPQMGMPQGGPISPILSNILLNRLDKELDSRGLNFVRYADDVMIFCKSLKAANRVN